MSAQRQRPIEMFDEVRGDIFSIPREDFVEIYEYADHDFLEIFRGFGAFFIGKKGDPEPEIQARDKRNVGVIKRLIEHQKVNAMRELARKKSGKDAIKARWNGPRQSQVADTNVYDRIRTYTNVCKSDTTVSDIAEEEDLDTAKALVSKSSGGIGKRGGQMPPACNPLSVEEAKTIIKKYVPTSISELHGMMLAPDRPSKLCMDLVKAIQEEEWENFFYEISLPLHPATSDDAEANEKECEKIEAQFDKPLIGLYEHLKNPERWMLAFAKAYADAINPATTVEGKPIRNRDAFIMARMKSVTQALKTLEALEGSTQA